MQVKPTIDSALGLFAKFWEPGKVKTRLAQTIGIEPACAIYQAFLSHLLNQLTPVTRNRWIAFTPSSRKESFGELAPGWSLVPQEPGNLGQRMQGFFEFAFSRQNAEKVIVIGADCPQLPISFLHQADEKLNNNEVVIGPSRDGGYYLIAMKGQTAPVFNDISWSSATVLDETIGKLEQQGRSWELLEELTDVDDEDDLHALLAHLSDPANKSVANLELLGKLQHTLSLVRGES